MPKILTPATFFSFPVNAPEGRGQHIRFARIITLPKANSKRPLKMGPAPKGSRIVSPSTTFQGRLLLVSGRVIFSNTFVPNQQLRSIILVWWHQPPRRALMIHTLWSRSRVRSHQPPLKEVISRRRRRVMATCFEQTKRGDRVIVGRWDIYLYLYSWSYDYVYIMYILCIYYVYIMYIPRCSFGRKFKPDLEKAPFSGLSSSFCLRARNLFQARIGVW